MAPLIALMILLLTAVLIFRNGRLQNISSNLIFTMVVIAILLFSHYFFTFRTSRFWLAVFFRHSLPVYFLLGPSLYFLIRRVFTVQGSIRLRDIWHFIPSALALIAIFPYIIKPWSFKLQVADDILNHNLVISRVPFLFDSMPIVNFILGSVSIFGYIIYCLWWSRRFFVHYLSCDRIQNVEAHKVIRFIRLLLISCLLGTLAFIQPYFKFHQEEATTLIQFSAQPWMYIFTILLAFIPLIIHFNPEILYGFPQVALNGAKNIRHAPKLFNDHKEALEDDTAVFLDNDLGFDEHRFKELVDRILTHMEERKPYLDPEFSIESLATQLEVPKHQVYYCFSNILKTRFTQFRSVYRTRHAQKLIREGASSSMTLLAIGFQSGFTSSASFRSVFKEVTGMTPSDYQRSLEQPLS